MEIEDTRPIHSLYREHVYSGLAFSATRRLATLQRTCERITCLMDASNSFSALGGGKPSTCFSTSHFIYYYIYLVVPQVN